MKTPNVDSTHHHSVHQHHFWSRSMHLDEDSFLPSIRQWMEERKVKEAERKEQERWENEGGSIEMQVERLSFFL